MSSSSSYKCDAEMKVLTEVILFLAFATRVIDSYTAISMNLTEIPAGSIHPQETTVDLTRNLITRVEDNAFAGFQRLEIIRLSYNQINFVSDSAFNGTVLRELHLDNNKLTTGFRLAGVGSTLQHLTLQRNDIETFGKDELNSVINLRRVNLQSNSLRSIHPDTFTSCAASLQQLFLSNNIELRSVPGELFRNMSNLDLIDLQSTNSLDTFPDFSFLPEENVVTKLFISTAVFGDLPPAALHNLPNLRHLLFSNVQLSVFPDLSRQSGSLNVLVLTGGRIRSIPDKVFDNLPLNALYLSRNELSEIPNLTPLLPRLKTLDLSNNNFGNVPCQTLLDILVSAPKLNYIDFTDTGLRTFPDIFQLNNSFTTVYIKNGATMHCDCAMKWMINLESQVFTNVKGSSMPCASPARIANIQWSDVTMDELCQDNNATTCGRGASPQYSTNEESTTQHITVSMVTDAHSISETAPSSLQLSYTQTSEMPTVTGVTTQQSQNGDSVLIPAVAAGLGAALIILIIVVVVLVYKMRKRNDSPTTKNNKVHNKEGDTYLTPLPLAPTHTTKQQHSDLNKDSTEVDQNSIYDEINERAMENVYLEVVDSPTEHTKSTSQESVPQIWPGRERHKLQNGEPHSYYNHWNVSDTVKQVYQNTE